MLRTKIVLGESLIVLVAALFCRVGHAEQAEETSTEAEAQTEGDAQETEQEAQSGDSSEQAEEEKGESEPEEEEVKDELADEAIEAELDEDEKIAGDAKGDAEQPAKDPEVEEIVVVGSRRIQDRSVIETPVAVDFLQMDQIATATGQLDINQLLQYVAPSFNSNHQSGCDGADHIDPATLRGLGPDQTLVLINGKRRHQSSLINIFGSRGRGNTGTDLNTIPIAAVERIEILRDGASAQYGSDAIAGVVNIVLKEDVEKFVANVNAGFRNAKPPKGYDVLRDETIDGETFQVNGNYGVKVLDKGFINLTMDYLYEDRTNRPTDPEKFDIYRRQFGDAAGTNFSAFMNAKIPLSNHTDFYAFGGLNHRYTDAYAWTRHADDPRNVPEIYKEGFDPHITSNITDYSISAGVRSKLAGWNVDADNTFGRNRFHYIIDGTLNASLLEKSPTRFDAGGHQFSQNTTGIHITRWFMDPLAGMNLAFGVEHRIDNYQIFAGEEGSYKNYGIVQVNEPVYDPITGEIIDVQTHQVDLLGRAAGSQGFPGLQPENEVDEDRTNIAAYADVELDIIEDVLMVGAAGRAEHYSDFGNTIDGKVASRWTIYDDLEKFMIAARGSVSTGFRAPSLAQIHYNTLYTDFEGGQAIDKIIAKNHSPITRALGIPALKEEESVNASVGFVARYDFLSLTVDGYYVKIRDRIVLTGSFDSADPDIGAELDALNVGAAQFFTNALDTDTFGMDLILSALFTFGDENTLHAALAGNFNKMELKDIHTNDKLAGKEDTYFGQRDQYFLLASAPKAKANLTLNYRYRMLNFHLRGVYFHEVVLIDWLDTEDVYEPNFTLDVAAGVDINENFSVLLGAQNVLNAYPTQQDTETETGGLWDAVQMGYNGAFYFMKAKFSY